ncbi:hypothetical protein BDF21DRAFT_492074 [Thamnidium elegans]|nr:hypothetical protein BDF21DRAFT_492074 [Thamnidium elegans]
MNNNLHQSSMNLLTSPFHPEQTYNQSEHIQLQSASYHTPPSNEIGVMPQNIMYNQSPSPQYETTNNFEFISHSPESSSSTESNLISPPQHYYPSDFSWPESTTIGFTQPLSSQYNRHPATKRSSSVPPHFHKYKPAQQDSMYNQFQLTPGLQHPPLLNSSKPLPMQIPRVNMVHAQSNRLVNKEELRRQLDQKLEKINFDDITVAELKEALRERGLSATGRKAELLARLKRERDLLVNCSSITAVSNGGLTSPPMTTPLHRRVTNLNLSDASPTKRYQRLYSPYSPPPLYSAIHHHHTGRRLASSVPESNTPFLNDQFMKKPSCLRKSIDEEDQKDVWDDQTLQDFLSQI